MRGNQVFFLLIIYLALFIISISSISLAQKKHSKGNSHQLNSTKKDNFIEVAAKVNVLKLIYLKIGEKLKISEKEILQNEIDSLIRNEGFPTETFDKEYQDKIISDLKADSTKFDLMMEIMTTIVENCMPSIKIGDIDVQQSIECIREY